MREHLTSKGEVVVVAVAVNEVAEGDDEDESVDTAEDGLSHEWSYLTFPSESGSVFSDNSEVVEDDDEDDDEDDEDEEEEEEEDDDADEALPFDGF